MLPSYEEALRRARERLADAGVWDVTGDLETLADCFLGRVDPPTALARFQAAVAERCARIPLAHITGSVSFDGLHLVVGSGVFVPRAESVGLVEWAAGYDVVPHGGRVLDLCSGVGALGLAVARRRPDLSVACVERDDTAVQYLRRNVARHAAVTGRVEIEVADLFEPGCLPRHRGADLIVANPPYVAPHVRLLPEWAEHQPKGALYSGPDGLDLIGCIVAHAVGTLRPGGWLGLEHCWRQPAPVRRLLVAAGFTDISTSADPTGDPRITVARTPRQETSWTLPARRGPTG
jgi:release factor glutamine methyltransferase